MNKKEKLIRRRIVSSIKRNYKEYKENEMNIKGNLININSLKFDNGK